MTAMIGVAVLGSTGSIGESTLDVLARHPDRFRVVALGARTQRRRSSPQQVDAVAPDYAALATIRGGRELEGAARARAASTTRVLAGPEALVEIAALPEVASTSWRPSSAPRGCASTLAAARAGKRLLLANKESLVMAGPLLMRTRARLGRDAAAGRQRAQRDLPVPAARCALRRGAARRAPRPAHRLGRAVPRLAASRRSRA